VFTKKFMKTMMAVLMALGLVTSLVLVAPAQEKKKEWKDRAEYDLFESITKTPDPNQWLATLDKWKQQYPQTDYADIRRKLYLAAYRQLNKPREAFDAAQEVLKDNPNDLVALSAILQFIYPLAPPNTPQLSASQTADLDVAEKAANTVLNNLDTVYSKDNRPPDMTDEQVAKAKPDLKAFAQKTIGYIALVRKDYEKAVTELTKALQLDPNQGQVSFWLGTATLAQNKTKPELQPVALFDFARAAAYSGAGSLPAADRKQITDYLTKVYAQYHGSNEGLDKLMASAQTNAIAPAGFGIKSKADIDREHTEADEAAAKANPMLALWRNIKKELQSDNGSAYFDANMKGAELPGGVNGVAQFKGKLVSMTPANRPKELVLAMEDPTKPDVTLKLDSPLPGKMDPGGEIAFSGVADSFNKDPFMVTFNVDKSKIQGWTGKNVPAHGKKSGAF
jgi:tetratricopeptide (TPR) repeat protein